jgi:hypothetical protein
MKAKENEMSNPYKVGDRIIVESGMSKKLVGLTGLVIYVDGEWCECELEGRKDYDRVHYSALAKWIKCWYCLGDYLLSEFTDDMYCPECDLKRGAETLKEESLLDRVQDFFENATEEDLDRIVDRANSTPKEQFTKGCRAEDKAILPEDAQARKERPVYSGVYCYFPKMIDCLRKNNINVLSYPRALCAISHQSWIGNQQHHPDKPLHWDKTKSTDNEDAFLRHWIEGDLIPALWRAFAVCERILDNGGKVRCNYEGCHSDLNLNYSLTHKQWFDVLLYTLTRLEKELEK